jgi:hypothetical protein
MGDDYEQTLLILKECFVYRIGPRPNAAGYKAQDWDPTKFIWSGRLVIVEKGDKCTIKFEDPNTSEIFALCPVDDTAVEPVVDSSRYFVLRIQDGSGRHAFVGMGFTERNDAFDFNTTILDHLKHVKARHEQAAAVQRLSNAPKVDYSLQGTIHVELKGATGKGTSAPRQQGNLVGGGGGGLLLPPPPKARTSVKQPAQSHQPQQQQQQARNDDPFALFAGAPSQQQQPHQQQHQQQFQQPNLQQQQFQQFQQPQQQFQQPQQQQQNNLFGGFSSPQQTTNSASNNNVDWFL